MTDTEHCATSGSNEVVVSGANAKMYAKCSLGPVMTNGLIRCKCYTVIYRVFHNSFRLKNLKHRNKNYNKSLLFIHL